MDGQHSHGGGNGASLILILALALVLVVSSASLAIVSILHALLALVIALCCLVVLSWVSFLGVCAIRTQRRRQALRTRAKVIEGDWVSPYPAELYHPGEHTPIPIPPPMPKGKTFYETQWREMIRRINDDAS